MQLAVRSYLAAGVAVAGVGVLAASPVAPPMPDIKVSTAHSSAAVTLSALANPIEGYAEAFSVAFQNAVALGERIADDPAPILSQIVKNQLVSAAAVQTFVDAFGDSFTSAIAETPEQLKEAADKFSAGDVTGALNTLVNAALGPIVNGVVNTLLFNPEIWTGLQNAIRQPIANTLAVVDLLAVPNVYNLLGPLLAPVQVITDVTNAVGAAGDGVFAGIEDGDLEQVANAVLNLGPDVTYAILNGNPVSPDYSAGLLGPQGIVAGLLSIRDLVADAITPAATTSALAGAGLTKAATTAVTLDVAPQAIEAPKAPAAEAAGTDGVSATDTPASAEAPAKEATPEATDETATPAEDAGAVKESPKAVPGKTGTSTTTKKANPLKDVGDGIRGALKNVGKGFRDAVAGTGGKTAKPAKAETATKSGGASGSAGGSGSSEGSSGGAE